MASGVANEPTSELRRRILEAARAEAAPTRQRVRHRGRLALAAAVIAALAIFLHFGGVRQYDRPTLLVLWTCLGWSAAVTVAASIGPAAGRPAASRSRSTLLALIIAVPFVLLLWKIGVSASFGSDMIGQWPARPGFRCLGLSIAMALPFLFAFLLLRRRSDPVHPGLAGAALGVTAGVFAGTLVDLWCPIAFVAHVLLGHILPLVITAALGAWAGRVFLRP